METSHPEAPADRKETPSEHLISVDIPGLKKEDVKIEVLGQTKLRITGRRKEEQKVEGEESHKAERWNGVFQNNFTLPGNVALDKRKERIEDGVLRIVVPKSGKEKGKQPKLNSVAKEQGFFGKDVKATKVG